MKKATAPQPRESLRLPLDIPIPAYFFDHHIEGKPVLAAVEALQVLAGSVKQFRPKAAVTAMTAARFDKFLPVPSDRPEISAFAEMEATCGGEVRAQLLTRLQSGKSSMTRQLVHAAVCFRPELPVPEALPLDLQACLEGVCTAVAPEALYRELVPFGPAYRNIAALHVSTEGALARINSPAAAPGPVQMRLLGSPFVLDAAFHAACVWAQRYRSIVAFPVGFERRSVYRPTRPGRTYFARITPAGTEGSLLGFDIAISDPQGALFESLQSVWMRDVSGGRIQPPPWIKHPAGGNPPLARIRRRCRAVALIEIKTVAPFAQHCLSEFERQRFERMGAKRRASYLAARLACKRVSRTLAGGDGRTPAAAITTVCADAVRPCCPAGGTHEALPCSVSHDDRFAVAVAAGGRPGVDVERLSERVLKSQRLFISAAEALPAASCGLAPVEAAVRIWSLKEAVAKALNLDLTEAWRRTVVVEAGREESRFRIDSEAPFGAVHETVGDHVFTYVCLP